MVHFSERLRRVQQTLAPGKAILLSSATDLAYFADFQILLPEEREGFLLITPRSVYLMKATFSPAPSDVSFLHVLENCRPASLAQHVSQIATQDEVKDLAIDLGTLFVDEYQALQSVALQNKFSLVSLEKERIWKLRMIKDKTEATALRQAGQIAHATFEHILKQLHIGVTEREVANQIEIELLRMGAQQTAFPTIVAFGPNGAAPHYQPGNVALRTNMPILIDMGARFHGYRSDLTRSFWFGNNPSAEFVKIEKIVTGAYEATVAFLEKAVRTHTLQKLHARDLDQVARIFITEHGEGHHFIHTTGHGVGLDIHEPPSLNGSNSQLLQAGMVITIEPGIYLPGQFGYRHENTIFIGDTTIEVLT